MTEKIMPKILCCKCNKYIGSCVIRRSCIRLNTRCTHFWTEAVYKLCPFLTRRENFDSFQGRFGLSGGVNMSRQHGVVVCAESLFDFMDRCYFELTLFWFCFLADGAYEVCSKPAPEHETLYCMWRWSADLPQKHTGKSEKTLKRRDKA